MPLDALTRAATFDPETRTVEAVIATPNPVMRRDARGPYAEVLDMSTLDLSEASGLPVVDTHRTASVRDHLGRVRSIRPEGDKLIAVLEFSSASDVQPVLQRIADGTLTGVSIGYRVAGWTEKQTPTGRAKSPTSWRISEVTVTATPADPDARFRSTTKDSDMDDTTTAPDPQEIERTRRSEIRTLCRSAGMTAEAADELIDSGASVDEAKAAAFDAMSTRRTAPVIRTATPSNDDPTVTRSRMEAALVTRAAGGECPPESREFVGLTLVDLARSSLQSAGVSTRGMSADEVLSRSAHGTSDFPILISGVANKVAIAAYRATESPLKRLCRQRTLSNFKQSTSVRLGEMGRLAELDEHGEITHTSRAESGETMALKTFARGLSVSRKLLIDDDLGLLGDMSAAFGEAAAQTEADELFKLIDGNPTMSDGNPVFGASRENLATGTSSHFSTGVDILTGVRKHMRGIKGLDGQTVLNIAPKYIVCGAENETAFERLLAEVYAAQTADANPFAGKLELLIEPRITADQVYFFADPARTPTLQYGYLASAPGVQIQRSESWDSLGFKFRAYLDFGCGWTGWRGAFLSDGDA